MFSLPIGMVKVGSVVYQIYHGKIWIEIAVSLLIDAQSPVYFAMALEIVLNRREDGLVRLSDTAAGFNTCWRICDCYPTFKLSPLADTEVAMASTMCAILQSQLYIGPRSRCSDAVFVAFGI